MGEAEDRLGLSGASRMDRQERLVDRMVEALGRVEREQLLGKQDRAELRAWLDRHEKYHDRWEEQHAKHVEDHEAEHKVLNVKVYGALGVVGTFAAIVVANGGRVPG